MVTEPYLPEEILQLVISHLPNPVDDSERIPLRSTLAAFCLVNKQCYRLAQALLYHNIWLQDTHASTVKLLVRTLIYSPMIADLVGRLSVGDNVYESAVEAEDADEGEHYDDHGEEEGNTSTYEIESAESYEEVVHASTSLSEETRQVLVEGLCLGELPANVAMLFIACRRLEVLELVMFEGRNTYISGNVLEECGRDPARSDEFNDALPLSLLRELRLSCGDEEGYLKMNDLTWLIRIGQLSTFHVDKLEVAQCQTATYGAPTKIKHLELTHVDCDAHSLDALLACCPELENLRLQVRGEGSLVTFQWMSKSIVEHSKRIEEVRIDTSVSLSERTCHKWKSTAADRKCAQSLSEEEFDGGGMEASLPLSDMRELKSLQRLELSAVAVYGKDDEDHAEYPNFEVPVLTEILPTSLEGLELFDCMAEEMEGMKTQLMRLWVDERFENLSKVRLVPRDGGFDVRWNR